MAQVLTDEQSVLMRPWQIWLRIVLAGAAIGIIYWIIAGLLARYVIEPLACRDIAESAVNCVNAISLSGNVSSIVTALVAILILIRMNIAQPVILAVGTAALFWDFAAWTTGLFWLEAIAWAIVLYAASYGLFAWITRYAKFIPAVILSLVIVLVIRIAVIL
jgi:hypothetical protein